MDGDWVEGFIVICWVSFGFRDVVLDFSFRVYLWLLGRVIRLCIV